jgi:hypothetical protein
MLSSISCLTMKTFCKILSHHFLSVVYTKLEVMIVIKPPCSLWNIIAKFSPLVLHRHCNQACRIWKEKWQYYNLRATETTTALITECHMLLLYMNLAVALLCVEVVKFGIAFFMQMNQTPIFSTCEWHHCKFVVALDHWMPTFWCIPFSCLPKLLDVKWLDNVLSWIFLASQGCYIEHAKLMRHANSL